MECEVLTAKCGFLIIRDHDNCKGLIGIHEKIRDCQSSHEGT